MSFWREVNALGGANTPAAAASVLRALGLDPEGAFETITALVENCLDADPQTSATLALVMSSFFASVRAKDEDDAELMVRRLELLVSSVYIGCGVDFREAAVRLVETEATAKQSMGSFFSKRPDCYPCPAVASHGDIMCHTCSTGKEKEDESNADRS